MHPHHAAAWRLMSSMVFGSCLDLRIQWKVRQQLRKLSRPTSEKFLRHRTSGKTSSIETTCLRIRRIKKHHVHVCIPTWYCLNISHRIYKNTCDHPVPYIIHTYIYVHIYICMFDRCPWVFVWNFLCHELKKQLSSKAWTSWTPLPKEDSQRMENSGGKERDGKMFYKDAMNVACSARL